MGALRRRWPLAIYENTSKIIWPIVRDRRRPSAMTSQETKKFVSCDHRRSSLTATCLKNLWEMSKSCFFLNKQGNNQLKFDRNHELTLNGATVVPWWEISKHIGCHLRRSPMYENFRAFAIGDKRRESSVTVCDEWELGLRNIARGGIFELSFRQPGQPACDHIEKFSSR
jgi:hypothetical protein